MIICREISSYPFIGFSFRNPSNINESTSDKDNGKEENEDINKKRVGTQERERLDILEILETAV